MRNSTIRKREERTSNRVAIITVAVIVCCLAIVVSIKNSSLRKKADLLSDKQQTINEQIESEEERKADLEEEQIYVQTKDYIEKTAKEKLGLVNSDEVIIRPED